MNTACSTCPTPSMAPLATQSAISTWFASARAWGVRWWASPQARLTESQLTALDGLRADTLKDIGAPEWMVERAWNAQERARQGGLFERDSIHWR